ncbi:MAG: hypothetical protein AVDCRST_MAG05-4284, partial [uncultured Rubrobacteraceae bacterium]
DKRRGVRPSRPQGNRQGRGLVLRRGRRGPGRRHPPLRLRPRRARRDRRAQPRPRPRRGVQPRLRGGRIGPQAPQETPAHPRPGGGQRAARRPGGSRRRVRGLRRGLRGRRQRHLGRREARGDPLGPGDGVGPLREGAL